MASASWSGKKGKKPKLTLSPALQSQMGLNSRVTVVAVYDPSGDPVEGIGCSACGQQVSDRLVQITGKIHVNICGICLQLIGDVLSEVIGLTVRKVSTKEERWQSLL